MHVWVYDPHSGGVKISAAVKQRAERRIRAYAEIKYAGKFTRLGIRFHGVFCYIDAYTEPVELPESLLLAVEETREQYLERRRNVLLHLCRLRYFGDEERWSMAFYTYSNEKYEPSVFDNGSFHGTPEEAFETAEVYLQDE
ncbi:MAG: hypothetical protein PHD43_22770 [Methylococcales bacterium]|nr:hypothetical protein [Methylococcales bacterium]